MIWEYSALGFVSHSYCEFQENGSKNDKMVAVSSGVVGDLNMMIIYFFMNCAPLLNASFSDMDLSIIVICAMNRPL